MLALVDDISHNCYYGVETQLNIDFMDLVSNQMLLNVLYNAGYMFTDILYMVTIEPDSIEEYPYNLATWIGDFIMRFFYREDLS
jgi:hypothetical protein